MKAQSSDSARCEKVEMAQTKEEQTLAAFTYPKLAKSTGQKAMAITIAMARS